MQCIIQSTALAIPNLSDPIECLCSPTLMQLSCKYIPIYDKTAFTKLIFASIIMNAAQEIKDKGLKVTHARVKVFDTLQPEGLALSHMELEPLLGKIDRITLYRILNDFEEVGLVHKVIDMDGVTRFAICRQNCTTHHHNDNHIHFNCTVCHKMYCLDNVSLPGIVLPEGFRATGQSTIIYGSCTMCN